MGQEQDYVRGQGEAHVVQIRKALAAIGLLFPLVLTLGLTPAHAESVPEPEPNVEVSSDSSEQVADPAQESAEDQTREEIEVPGPANPEDQESYPEVETPDHSGDTEEPDLSLDPKNANENKGPYRAPQITSWSTGGATFQPGYIISDQNMYNSDAMTAAQVQSFLNQRVPRCTIGDPGRAAGSKWGNTRIAQKCLRDYRMNTSTISGDTYCNSYSARSNESAAEIIVRVGKACGISPRVLLVMLQKEQSLITDTWPTVRQIDVAMGANCPDTGPDWAANCDPRYFGFQKQVHRAAWLLKYYKAHPTAYRFQAGKTVSIQYAPNPACGSSPVYLQNQATAALYIYTPYQPGGGPGCVSVDKTNFFNLYNGWFGSPTAVQVHPYLASLYQTARNELGEPSEPAVLYSGSSLGQRFEHGSMYWHPDTGPSVVQGEIRSYYWGMGSWGSELGFPLGRENRYKNGGLGQSFEGGTIYWHPDTGPSVVQGEIRSYYWGMGSWGSELGFPLGVEHVNQASGVRHQDFEFGRIYLLNGGKLIPVVGIFWEIASARSDLGLPTTQVFENEVGGRTQEFEHGKIVVDIGGGVSVVTDGN